MICISFDTDRMNEPAMSRFLEDVDIPGDATFFCTERYDCLVGSRHELCPHVAFREERRWRQTLEAGRSMFPDATGWRSHSCMFSHILAEQLAQLGYEYVSIHDELGSREIAPHRHAWGLWHMPIYYMDNLDFSFQRFWPNAAPPFDERLITTAVEGDALFVFAFHPVHIVLNSPSAEEYFARRAEVSAEGLYDHARWTGYGTGTFFEQLLSALRTQGSGSVRLDRALAHYRSSAMDGPAAMRAVT